MSVVMTGGGGGGGHKSNTRRTNSLQVYFLQSVQGFGGENIFRHGTQRKGHQGESIKASKGEGDEGGS